MNTDNIKEIDNEEIDIAEIDPGNSKLPKTLWIANCLNRDVSLLMQCITDTALDIEHIDSYELVRLAKEVSSTASELTTLAEAAAAEARNCSGE